MMNQVFLLRYLLCLIILLPCGTYATSATPTFLVFGGKTGWIGRQIVRLLQEDGYHVYPAESRLEYRKDIEAEILHIHPDYIINCAGVTGVPNVDWCEIHHQDTLRANIIGALTLADIAYMHHIPVTNFGTGCIYEYDVHHPLGSGIGFKEEDIPNFSGSFYSKTKIMLDTLLAYYPNVLNLRVRMPVSSDLHPKNFITKIIKYQKVINISNSMTILDDLLPIAISMTLRGLKGNYNFTNPGTLSHNEILDLYKKYIDPDFKYVNFSIEEQNSILLSQRSNNELDVSKLLAEYPNIPHVRDSIHRVFQNMQRLLSQNN